MDEESDSFHSLNQSNVFSDDLEREIDLDDDDTLTDEESEFQLKNNLIAVSACNWSLLLNTQLMVHIFYNTLKTKRLALKNNAKMVSTTTVGQVTVLTRQ